MVRLRLRSQNVANEDMLTVDRLPTAEAVLTLGAIVVRTLQEQRIAVLFVADDGSVQVCPPAELQLDALPEDVAIASLLEQGHEEQSIIVYLRGRSARQRSVSHGSHL